MVPSGAIPYAPRTRFPDVLVRGRANVVNMPLYRDAAVVPALSGTFTLYKPGGTTLVDAAAITISSTVTATYTIPAATLPTTLTPLGDGWRELWSLVLTAGADPIPFERTAALARVNLSFGVSDRDINELYPTWAQGRGTVITNWQNWIDEAESRIVQRLLRDGHVPYLIRTPDALREAHLHLSCALVCRGLKPGTVSGGESTWLVDAKYHEAEYERAYTTTNWQADYDHDGHVDDPAARTRATGILYPGSPPRWAGLPQGVA